MNSLSVTSPIKFLYALACNIGVVIKNGTTITKTNNINAIIKLFFASFDAFAPLSSIISIIPANTKNSIKVVKPDVKSSLSTGNFTNEYIATIIKAIPYDFKYFFIFSPSK